MTVAHHTRRSPGLRRTCWSWVNPADVKNTDPTKNVTPTTWAERLEKYGGNDPNAKHVEPMMNSNPARRDRSPGEPRSRRPQTVKVSVGESRVSSGVGRWELSQVFDCAGQVRDESVGKIHVERLSHHHA